MAKKTNTFKILRLFVESIAAFDSDIFLNFLEQSPSFQIFQRRNLH